MLAVATAAETVGVLAQRLEEAARRQAVWLASETTSAGHPPTVYHFRPLSQAPWLPVAVLFPYSRADVAGNPALEASQGSPSAGACAHRVAMAEPPKSCGTPGMLPAAVEPLRRGLHERLGLPTDRPRLRVAQAEQWLPPTKRTPKRPLLAHRAGAHGRP